MFSCLHTEREQSTESKESVTTISFVPRFNQIFLSISLLSKPPPSTESHTIKFNKSGQAFLAHADLSSTLHYSPLLSINTSWLSLPFHTTTLCGFWSVNSKWLCFFARFSSFWYLLLPLVIGVCIKPRQLTSPKPLHFLVSFDQSFCSWVTLFEIWLFDWDPVGVFVINELGWLGFVDSLQLGLVGMVL